MEVRKRNIEERKEMRLIKFEAKKGYEEKENWRE